MMASKVSDREYVLRILDAMEGKPNALKAQKIATLPGGRIRQRLMQYGKAVNARLFVMILVRLAFCRRADMSSPTTLASILGR